MFGYHSRTYKSNQDLRKNRRNMFQGNEAFSDTYGKQSDKPREELSESKKREVESWSRRLNYENSIRNITFFIIMAILAGLIIYAILYQGLLDYLLNMLP